MYLQEVHGDQRMSVGQFELSVKDRMMRNVTPNTPSHQLTRPASYHGAPTSLLSVVNTLIFRDAIDVLYDPAVTHRRRRIEWPSLDINLRQMIVNPSTRATLSQITVNKTKALPDEEFAKCAVNFPLADDDPAIHVRLLSTTSGRSIMISMDGCKGQMSSWGMKLRVRQKQKLLLRF